MKRDCALCLTALLSGIPMVQPLPGAAADPAISPVEPTHFGPQEETTTITTTSNSLALREDGALQPYRQHLAADLDDGDWPGIIKECSAVYDKLKHDISTLPDWVWQPLAKGLPLPVAAGGTCHFLGFPRCAGATAVGVAGAMHIILQGVADEKAKKKQGARPAATKVKGDGGGKGKRTRRGEREKMASRRARMIETRLSILSRGRARVESVAEVLKEGEDEKEERLVPSSHLAARLADQGGYVVDITGLSLCIEDGPVADHRFTDRGDGTGDVHVRPRAFSAGLGRRADGAGFKVSYKVVNEGTIPVRSPTLLASTGRRRRWRTIGRNGPTKGKWATT
ncbi:hypothetical protein PG994_005035 [Apiospora phragmitis]|uniref:Uncharacterized protein n=1 Tax=Apiospora phragmitis TaxID=2905665 RepID=A0ABR1VUY7_9PEZI